MRYTPNAAGNMDARDADGKIVGEVGRDKIGWWWTTPGFQGETNIPREAKAKQHLESRILIERRIAQAQAELTTPGTVSPAQLEPLADPPPPPPPPPTTPTPPPAAEVAPQAAPPLAHDSPETVPPSAPSPIPELPMLSAFTPDLRDRVSAVAQRALEAVISSHLVDNPVPKIIDDIQDAIGAAIKLAAMLKGKGTKESISDRLSDFVTMAADAVAGVLELHGIESADLLDDIQDVIAAAVDGAIDTGAIDIVDDRLWNDGIRKLWAIIEDIAERDAGNLLALAERAEKNGHPRIAARRRRAAARIFARQERRAQQ